MRGPPVRPGSMGATSPPRVYGDCQSAQGLRGLPVRPGSTGAASPPAIAHQVALGRGGVIRWRAGQGVAPAALAHAHCWPPVPEPAMPRPAAAGQAGGKERPTGQVAASSTSWLNGTGHSGSSRPRITGSSSNRHPIECGGGCRHKKGGLKGGGGEARGLTAMCRKLGLTHSPLA